MNRLVSDKLLTRDMKKKLIFIFFAAFVFRLLLINVAFHGDLNNNISWGNIALKGLNGFYERKDFLFSIPNQPPAYILLFGLISFLYQNVDKLVWYLNTSLGIFPSAFVWFWRANGMIILVKLPSILADLGIGYIIYKFLKKREVKSRWLFSCVILWLFNPIVWYNSSIWGQTDAIVNLLGIATIYFLLERKLVKAFLLLTLSLLFKGSLLLFVPFLFIYAIWQKYPTNTWVKGVGYSLVVVLVMSFLFHPSFNFPVWFFNLYTKQILPGEVGDLSANAFNFWYLVNPGKILDSTIYFGLPARIWGYIITSIAIVVTIMKLKRQKTENGLLYSLTLIALVSFLFMTRIHERYLYPFFPIATLLVGLTSELIVPYILLSVTFLLNMYNLFWAPGIPVVENILKIISLSNILAILNIFALLWIVVHFCRVRLKSS